VKDFEDDGIYLTDDEKSKVSWCIYLKCIYLLT
jgi:hypothetical protein